METSPGVLPIAAAVPALIAAGAGVIAEAWYLVRSRAVRADGAAPTLLLTLGVRDHGPLPPPSVAALGAGLAEGLMAVHARYVRYQPLDGARNRRVQGSGTRSAAG